MYCESTLGYHPRLVWGWCLTRSPCSHHESAWDRQLSSNWVSGILGWPAIPPTPIVYTLHFHRIYMLDVSSGHAMKPSSLTHMLAVDCEYHTVKWQEATSPQLAFLWFEDWLIVIHFHYAELCRYRPYLWVNNYIFMLALLWIREGCCSILKTLWYGFFLCKGFIGKGFSGCYWKGMLIGAGNSLMLAIWSDWAFNAIPELWKSCRWLIVRGPQSRHLQPLAISLPDMHF